MGGLRAALRLTCCTDLPRYFVLTFPIRESDLEAPFCQHCRTWRDREKCDRIRNRHFFGQLVPGWVSISRLAPLNDSRLVPSALAVLLGVGPRPTTVLSRGVHYLLVSRGGGPFVSSISTVGSIDQVQAATEGRNAYVTHAIGQSRRAIDPFAFADRDTA